MSDYPDEEMKAMEEDYRRLANKCDDLEENIQTANSLLARCHSYMTRFPVERFFVEGAPGPVEYKRLQTDIENYLEQPGNKSNL